jgi:prepilin-type processing-associated H-X9-DG protein
MTDEHERVPEERASEQPDPKEQTPEKPQSGRALHRSRIFGRAAWGLLFFLPLFLASIVLVWTVFIAPAWQRADSVAAPKHMGLIFRMFANESPGMTFPELSPQPGMLAIRNVQTAGPPVVPAYLTDPSFLAGQSKVWKKYEDAKDPQSIFDHSYYIYLGYAIGNEAELEAFAEAYRQRVAQGLPFNEDLSVPPGKGNNGSDKIHRLAEGVERWFIADIGNPDAASTAQRGIPVLIERLDNRKPEGGNILYLDGQVEFVRYPGKWPMTERAMQILKSLEDLKNPRSSD